MLVYLVPNAGYQAGIEDLAVSPDCSRRTQRGVPRKFRLNALNEIFLGELLFFFLGERDFSARHQLPLTFESHHALKQLKRFGVITGQSRIAHLKQFLAQNLAACLLQPGGGLRVIRLARQSSFVIPRRHLIISGGQSLLGPLAQGSTARC